MSRKYCAHCSASTLHVAASTQHRLDLHNDSTTHNPTCLTKLPTISPTIGEGMTIGEGVTPTRLSKSHTHAHHHPARPHFPYPASSQNVSAMENGTYSMNLFTDEAVRLIHTHTPEEDGPLFLYVSFQAPHGPLQAPDRYVRRYADTIADPARRTYAGKNERADVFLIGWKSRETLREEGG